ncbi:MAG TPA: MFS transporter [Ktedonobacterales bacterium]|nr:MFS transporter [Ktedonobacterales bacterium]
MDTAVGAREQGATRGWVWLVFVFSVASFIETIFWGIMGAFTPLYLTHLGVPAGAVPFWTGATVAISSAVGLPFLPFWGALADRYARKPVIVRSFVAHVVAGALALVAGNVWVFILARGVMSLALGNSGLMLTTLGDRVPARRMGLAFSIMNSSAPVGAFVGPLLGGPIVDAYGFPALVAVNMALLALVVLGLTFGYRDSYRGTDRRPVSALAMESVGIIARSPRLRTLFPALFLLFAGWMMAFTYLPLAIQSLYHGDRPGTAVGAVIGGAGLAALALGPLMGWLADRFGHWRVLFAGGLVSLVLWPLPALTHDLVPFGVAWGALNGVVAGVFAISFSVLAASAAPSVRGRVMAFAYLPVNVGYMLGPALGGFVIRFGLFAVFPVAALITALGLAALRAAEKRPVERVARVA